MKLPDWRGSTVVCIASGPSLTAEDCELVRASGHTTIVTNTTFRACPWAHGLYAFDSKWWRLYIEEIRSTFAGILFTQSLSARKGVICVAAEPRFRNFGNSGACAISLAIVAGATRVVMLGYDCGLTGGRSHHHGDHPTELNNCGSIGRWPIQFARLARYAQSRRAVVLNASRETALTCFPRVALEQALSHGDVLDGAADVGRQDGGCAGFRTEHVARGS